MSRAAVITPEAVELQFETGSVGSRGLAFFLDVVITWVIMFGLITAALFAAAATGDAVPDWVGVTLVILLVLAVQFGYPIAFESLWHGRTPGKAALGLRVVTVEGGPVGFRHAAIRAALQLVDFWLTSGAAAVIAVLVTDRNQRLGDLAAGTVVLRERTGQRAPRSVSFVPPRGLEGYADLLDVSRLSPHAYSTVRAFLLRADSLTHDVRRQLAERLATDVSAAVPPPPSAPPLSAEDHLRCVAVAYQRRHAPVAAPQAAPDAAPAPEPPDGDRSGFTAPG